MPDRCFVVTYSAGFAGADKYLLNAEDSRSLQALMATPPPIVAVAASAGWEPWAIEVRLVRPDEMPPLPGLYRRFLDDGWRARLLPMKQDAADTTVLDPLPPPPFEALGCYCWREEGAAPYILLCPERIMVCSRSMAIGSHLHPQARYAYLLHAVLLHEMGHHALATHRPLTSKSDLHWEEGLANWLMLAWIGTLADVEFTGYVHAFVEDQPVPYARGLQLFEQEKGYALMDFWKNKASISNPFLHKLFETGMEGPPACKELVDMYLGDHDITEWLFDPASPLPLESDDVISDPDNIG